LHPSAKPHLQQSPQHLQKARTAPLQNAARIAKHAVRTAVQNVKIVAKIAVQNAKSVVRIVVRAITLSS
jgi:hypothetical protein